MNYLFLGAGAVLSVLVIADIIKTVFSTRGAGSLSSATIWLVWTPFFGGSEEKRWFKTARICRAEHAGFYFGSLDHWALAGVLPAVNGGHRVGCLKQHRVADHTA